MDCFSLLASLLLSLLVTGVEAVGSGTIFLLTSPLSSDTKALSSPRTEEDTGLKSELVDLTGCLMGGWIV